MQRERVFIFAISAGGADKVLSGGQRGGIGEPDQHHFRRAIKGST